jgi:hypothetical protein
MRLISGEFAYMKGGEMTVCFVGNGRNMFVEWMAWDMG